MKSAIHWSTGFAPRALVFVLGAIWPLFLSIANTNVSLIPDLAYFEGMKKIVGIGENDALVTNYDDNGMISFLSFDGWEWQVKDQHLVTDWLGYPRLDANSVFPMGSEVLIFDASRLINGLNIPEITVLEKQGDSFAIKEKVSLESELQDPDYFSVSINAITPLQDLLVLYLQVGVVGVGGKLQTQFFVRTDSGWIVGPSIEPLNGYWWPLYTERVDGVLQLCILQMEGYYDGTPKTFTVFRQALVDDAWQPLGTEGQFTFTSPWVGINKVQTLMSPDHSSMLLFWTDPNPVSPLELRNDGSGWFSAGELPLSSPVASELFLAKLGNGMALLRAGGANAPYLNPPLQHYHLLKFEDGNWVLRGDLPSHRTLYDYFADGLSYSLLGDRLTIFDFSRWNEAARAYNLASLEPILIKWFRDSTSAASGWESLDAFGYFNPLFTTDRAGIWLWHANLGWLYASGREPDQFWLWHPALDWTYYNHQLFNLDQNTCWLYSAPLNDFLWFESSSTFPRFFYSYACGEWVTDQHTPPYDPAAIDLIAEMAAAELEQEGMTVEINTELSLLVMSSQETVDGKLVTITIEAPWQYTTRVDYPSHARFDLDVSWILITVDGETVGIHSSEFWNQAQVLMPMHLTIDFFFHSQDSGISVQLIQFNNGTFDPPLREPFGP